MDLRIRFLQAAAALYASSEPATSAHLMLQSINLPLSTHDKSRSHRTNDQACPSCGTMLLFSSYQKTVTAVRQSRTASAKLNLQSTPNLDTKRPAVMKYTEIHCPACRRLTKHLLPAAAKGKATEDLPSRASNSDLVAAPNSNLASKRRAKIRKQGGLQALIANSTNQFNASTTNGLDLMDLMKQV